MDSLHRIYPSYFLPCNIKIMERSITYVFCIPPMDKQGIIKKKKNSTISFSSSLLSTPRMKEEEVVVFVE